MKEDASLPGEMPTLVEARGFGGRGLLRAILGLGLIGWIGFATKSLGTLWVIMAIIAMVMIHELGHFVTAKLSGMKVTEFFLGFGPRVFSIRRGETEYGMKVIPAGGYVKIVGMSSADEVPLEDEARTYRKASFPRRIAVSISGSLMHFIMAYLLLWSLFAFVGVPDRSKVEIAGLSQFQNMTSPARMAGLRVGDQIVSVDRRLVSSEGQLASIILSHAGREITLEVKQGRKYRTIRLVPVQASSVVENGVSLTRSSKSKGVIGVILTAPNQTVNPILALGRSAKDVASYSWQTLTALGGHFSPHGISTYVNQLQHPSTNPSSPGTQSRFESPIGIVRLASQAVHAGLPSVLGLLFSINVFVGVFNLIPLLPLDGGHVAIAIYERLRSRRNLQYRVDIMKLMPVTYLVFVVIVLLGVTALYLDVTHPIANPFG